MNEYKPILKYYITSSDASTGMCYLYECNNLKNKNDSQTNWYTDSVDTLKVKREPFFYVESSRNAGGVYRPAVARP